MKVLIEVYYIHYDTKCLRKGDFSVDSFEFGVNPDKAACESAIRFIREIRRGSPTMNVYKVVYNAIEITDIVKSELKRMDDEIWNGPF